MEVSGEFIWGTKIRKVLYNMSNYMKTLVSRLVSW